MKARAFTILEKPTITYIATLTYTVHGKKINVADLEVEKQR